MKKDAIANYELRSWRERDRSLLFLISERIAKSA